MSILWGLFETFLDFLSISVEPQHRDEIPQLGLITLYLSHWLIETSRFLIGPFYFPLHKCLSLIG